MEEYRYIEEDYIDAKTLKQLNNVMVQHDFSPDEIQSKVAFNRVFSYLVKLTKEAPDYIPVYEYLFPMFNRFVMDEELEEVENGLLQQYIAACGRVAERDNVLSKNVPWAYMENRPLMRGLNYKALELWREGNFEQAHNLFDAIYKCNEDDNIGARYPRKATAEKMTLEDFENRFVKKTSFGEVYEPEIFDWFDQSH